MAVAVVDLLEAVQVQHQHRRRTVPARDPAALDGQAFERRAPVGQPRQRVVAGVVARRAQADQQAQLRLAYPRGHAEQQREQQRVAPCRGAGGHMRGHEADDERGHRRGAQPQRLRPADREQGDLRGDDERGEAVADRRGAGGMMLRQQRLHQAEAQCLQPDEQPQHHLRGQAAPKRGEREQARGDHHAAGRRQQQRSLRQHQRVQAYPGQREHRQRGRQCQHAAADQRLLVRHAGRGKRRARTDDAPVCSLFRHRLPPEAVMEISRAVPGCGFRGARSIDRCN